MARPPTHVALDYLNDVLPFLAGFLIALALVPVARLLAHRTDIVARPRNDRWHRGTVPLLGGVAMAGGMFFGAILLNVADDIVVPLSAAMAMFIIGLVDDALALKPATKLIAQIAMAATMLYFGYRLNWLDSRLLDSILTMVWIVGLTNAFNLLDNMDGLCAGIALIVALMLIAGLAGGAAAERAGPEVMFLSLLAGSVAGFLVFNFPPASIFMGDSGALLLGFSLATLTLGHEGVRASRSDVVSIIAGPAFVLLIPIFDTTLVTVSRVLSGRSPAMGGRDHSSHRLVAIGLSERSAVLVLYSLAAIGGMIGIALRSASDGISLAAGGVFLLAMCGFAVYLSRVHVYEELPESAKVTPLWGEFLYKQRIVEVLIDASLTALAYYGVNQWYFDPEAYLGNAENFYRALPLVVAGQLVAFFIVGLYRNAWQYESLRHSVKIGSGVLLGTVGAQLALIVIYQYFSHSIPVFALYALSLTVLVTVSRMFERGVIRYVATLTR
jgi:UDP-GlcNAc:undecaprenyl-phosphate/decaprenyl-phosphate GlcNAc-1-phosphate transferase